jgi:hypothetical protein
MYAEPKRDNRLQLDRVSQLHCSRGSSNHDSAVHATATA